MLNCDLKKAQSYAERVIIRSKKELVTHLLNLPENFILSGVSIGISHSDYWGEQVGNLINQADQAMYKAKKAGKNQIMTVTGCLSGEKLIIQSLKSPPED